MNDINAWLSKFKDGWIKHDISQVIELFDKAVEYWETPYKQLVSLDDIKNEWGIIENQKDIRLETKVFNSVQDTHTVVWNLAYTDNKNELQQWAGTYLIRLNAQGKCCYFHQTGEKSN